MKKSVFNDRQQNLRAYDGVENLATFASQAAVEKYRQERKDFSAGAVAFLRKELKGAGMASVLDIGSGSSSFLYALSDAGLLSRGVGVEISKTRHEFAQRWKKEEGYDRVENINQDVRVVSFGPCLFDACTILDSTFTLFHSVDPALPGQVLRLAHKALKPAGLLILDMSNFVIERNFNKDGICEMWLELPSSNKFRYALHRIQCSAQEGMLCTDSRYLYRDRMEEARKSEYSKVYTRPQLKDLLLAAGFEKPVFYGGWDGSKYQPKTSERIMLACRKKGGMR